MYTVELLVLATVFSAEFSGLDDALQHHQELLGKMGGCLQGVRTKDAAGTILRSTYPHGGKWYHEQGV